MDANERLDAAYRTRRAVLGDEYVDRALANAEGVVREFQDHLTLQAWGAWARGDDVLSKRDRSLIVLAITAALGRDEEFKIHASTQAATGVTDAEIDELVFMISGYAGGPAALSARRVVTEVRAQR